MHMSKHTEKYFSTAGKAGAPDAYWKLQSSAANSSIHSETDKKKDIVFNVAK